MVLIPSWSTHVRSSISVNHRLTFRTEDLAASTKENSRLPTHFVRDVLFSRESDRRKALNISNSNNVDITFIPQ